jgi:hypothetical protein
MISPQNVLCKLHDSDVFKNWHQKNFLSHFFCQLDKNFEQKTKWEVGFFDQETNKIEVFAMEDDGFLQKPEDQVFKKPGDEVEQLEMGHVTLSLPDAIIAAKQQFSTLFPSEVLGDGFLILQYYQGATMWNFTFVSKSIKFLNVKLDAGSGVVIASDAVELIDKGN